MAQPWREPFGRGCALLEQGGPGGEPSGAEAVATPCPMPGPMVDGYRDFVSSILTRSTNKNGWSAGRTGCVTAPNPSLTAKQATA